MNTVKIISIIVAVAILGLLAGIGFKILKKNKTAPSQSNTHSKSNDRLNLPTNSNEFAWGVTVLHFPFPTYKESFTAKQMAEAKKLGVNYVRIEYTPNNPKASEVAVNAARDNGLKIVLVIPFGPNDIVKDKNLRQNTKDYVKAIVTKFKGKVAVYQLATEVASVALANNSGLHGIDKKDYPKELFAAVTIWVKTASESVKETDPGAKRLVNDQWVHIGWFDNYFAQGGDFDILGWNWFSDMGTNMHKAILDKSKNQTYDLLTKISGYNKPIWLTEVNRRLGSQGGKEKEQAEFISTMASYAAKQSGIKGFFVFNLVEDQIAPAQERGYGIVNVVDDGKDQRVNGYKQAFDSYKKAIQSNR